MTYSAGVIGAGGVAGMGLLGTHEVGAGGVRGSHAGGYRATDGIELIAVADVDSDTLDKFGETWEIRAFRGRYLQDWLVNPAEPWSWRNDAELAGSGSLGDLGAHTLDLVRFLVGDVPGGGDIGRVSGHQRTFVHERPVAGDGENSKDLEETRPVTVDDAFSAQLAFEGGAMGTVGASRVAPGHKNDQAIALHGSRGSLSFVLERLNELVVLRDGNRGYETALVTDGSDPYVDAWWPPGHVLGWEHSFVHESYEFISAVAEGGGFQPDFDDSLAVQRLLAAIDRSDRDGAWTDI